jgi:hypothetical protein
MDKEEQLSMRLIRWVPWHVYIPDNSTDNLIRGISCFRNSLDWGGREAFGSSAFQREWRNKQTKTQAALFCTTYRGVVFVCRILVIAKLLKYGWLSFDVEKGINRYVFIKLGQFSQAAGRTLRSEIHTLVINSIWSEARYSGGRNPFT